ncbi:MAG: PAS domain S-box protein [Rhodospirillales bacterium]|nr:PAS domain S-box protein [Rhodospirillales bacterium]
MTTTPHRPALPTARPAAEPPRLARLLGLGIGLIVLLGVGLGGHQWRERQILIDQGERDAANFARILAGQIETQIKIIDQGLLRLAERVAADPNLLRPGDRASHDKLQEWAALIPYQRGLILVDAKGAVLNDSLRFPVPTLSVAARDYFVHHQSTDSRVPHVSQPVTGRISGKRTFFISRRLNAPDGGFAGIAVASVELDRLDELFQAIEYRSELHIALFRTDGTLLVTWPENALPEAEGLGDRLLGALRESAGRHSTLVFPGDRMPHLFAHSLLLDNRLALMVLIDRAGVLESWMASVRIVVLVALLAVLAGGLAFALVFRQSRERGQVAERLRESEERYHDILDSSPDWIWEIDAQGRLTYASARVTEMLGYTPEELIGRSPLDLMAEAERQGAWTTFTALFKARLPIANVVNVNRRKDGHPVTVETSGTPVFGPDGTFRGYRGIDRDITRRKEAEERARRHLEILDLLGKVSAAANQATNGGEVLQAALDRICTQIGWPIGHAFVADPNEPDVFRASVYRHVGDFQRFGTWDEQTRRLTLPPGEGLPSRVAAAGRPLWFAEIAKLSWFSRAQLARQLGIHSAFAFPIFVEGRVAAVLEFFTPAHVVADANLIGALDPIAFQIGRVLERERATARIREAKELAEAGSRSKSEFLAAMSHELRTPLNAILGFSDVMLGQTFGPIENPRYRDYLGNIRDSGQHLLELINDILDIAAIEAGRINLSEEPVHLEAIVHSSLRLVRPRAQKNNIALEVALAPEIPTVIADTRRLKQILLNLLSNAVKFTPEGGRVTLAARLDAEGALLLTVTDTGIGMDEDGIAKALMPFGQVDSTLARRFEGTGLGLPLTKGLVEAHGGTLAVVSARGQGTTVTVRLPSARLRPAAA